MKVIFKINEPKKMINEGPPTGDLWQCHAILMTRVPDTREEASLEDYKNSIRVKCGITIVESDGPSEERAGLLFTRIRMRFIPRMAPKTALREYTKIISQIEGIKKITFLEQTLIKAFTRRAKK
tara:strand:- start:301 stop:672 length:372 start_codon:yes stop_codon:yes gene_type:complete